MSKKIGSLIVIEGTDASGKETQTKLLIDRLAKENIPCRQMSFPRYETPTGRIVGQCYLGKERTYWKGDSQWFGEADSLDPKVASLYYAGDRRAAIPEIKQIINSGTNLVLNRYYQSNMAHQGGKLKTKKQRDDMFRWLETLELKLLELPKEDLTIFLHMPTRVSIKLREGRNEKADGHESNIDHLHRAEETYLQLADFYNWIKINCAPDGTIDSLRNQEDIHEEVYQSIIPFLSKNN